jgi:hypothetical protein
LSALRAFAYGTPGAFHLIALTILIVVASSVDLVLVGMPVKKGIPIGMLVWPGAFSPGLRYALLCSLYAML